MSLEDIGAVKALLGGSARAGAETADHGTFVVRESVPVLVVLPCEALDVVLAGLNWALLRSLRLMSEHVCLQVLERPTAVGNRADALLPVFLAELVASTTVAVL